MSEGTAGLKGWAIIELVGQRRLGGRVSEAMVVGVPFIRLDVPHPNDSTQFRATRFYNPAAIHSITPATEEIACAIARGAPEPVGGRRPPGFVTTEPPVAPERDRGERNAVHEHDDEDGEP